jgi:hypothetical protein
LRASTHPETKTADLRDDLRVLFDVAPHRSIGESRRVASKVLDMSAGTMSSAGRLRLFAAVLLVLNVLATAGAVVVNLPAQFGGVGTDAGDEFLTRGTAISAPLLPVVLLCIVVALSGRRDGWGWIGIAAAYATAITVGIGGWGELLAEPTSDTPGAVLLMSGLTWLVIAAALAVLATGAAKARRSS